MGSELNPGDISLENANRMYTDAEDQLILAKWWNKKLRVELAQELGRTEAALAQRFYAILKKRGLDPKAYRADMKQEGRRHLYSTSVAKQGWTRQEDILLWRRLKAGECFDSVVALLPGRSVEECRERYEILRQANASEISDQQQVDVAQPVTAGISAGAASSQPDSQSPMESIGAETGEEHTNETDDFLDALRQFPQQAGALSYRMDAMEKDMAYMRNNLQFVLDNLAQGLHNVAQYLTGQGHDFAAFETIKQENQALRNEIAEVRLKAENEKKELRRVYNELEFWLSEFMEMRKIEKVANLGELIPKLKYSYDRFGVLLQIERDA